MALGIGSIGWVVLGQVYNLAVELPEYQQNVTQKINVLHLHSAGRLTNTVQMLSEVSRQISNGKPVQASPPPSSELVRRGTRNVAATGPRPLGTPAAPNAPISVRVEDSGRSFASMAVFEVQPLIAPLTRAFAVVIFVVFMLLARDDIRDRAVRLMGSTRIHVTTVAMVDAATRVSRYLLMQFIVNLGYALVLGLALWAIGIPHPLLWAVTTFLLRFVPYVGILAAGVGPILLALAVSPHWSMAGWTLAVYVFLELLAANVIEPLLYGSSTGVSALAILVAAIFWTWLWGIPGLLLSTPLTVCLIVVGRHVPRLGFLSILFGENKVLDPPERLYQRILASDLRDAAKLIEEESKTSSREAAYDKLIIPTLNLIEEARHTERLEAARAESALQQIEDLIEEQWIPDGVSLGSREGAIICVSAKDLADDIACQLLKQVLVETHSVVTLASDLMSADVDAKIELVRPAVLCVVGIPPQAIRHIRVRCHQLRTKFPEIPIVACVLSTECDLANVRGRIPIGDANHVVCSLQQAQEYLMSLEIAAEAVPNHRTPPAMAAPSTPCYADLDESSKDVFEQITVALAKTFEAPIALIHMHEEGNALWQAQCGLGQPEGSSASSLGQSALCAKATLGTCLVVADTAEDPLFCHDPILLDKGIRFFAGMPILSSEGGEIGSLCVFDTRPRQVTPPQEAGLKMLAKTAADAIALQRGEMEKLRPQTTATSCVTV